MLEFILSLVIVVTSGIVSLVLLCLGDYKEEIYSSIEFNDDND